MTEALSTSIVESEAPLEWDIKIFRAGGDWHLLIFKNGEFFDAKLGPIHNLLEYVSEAF